MAACNDGVPMPIVTLNRVTMVTTVAVALATQQPAVTTALFVVAAGAAVFGRRGSLIFAIGSRLLRERNARALEADRWEDRRLMRFNNAIAATMLGGAQIAFLFGATAVGWALAVMVAVAAAVALGGFCLGCFLYTQFRLNMVARARG